jgi:hypothetical protein
MRPGTDLGQRRRGNARLTIVACSQIFNPGGFDRSFLVRKTFGAGRSGDGAPSAEPGWCSGHRSACCRRPALCHRACFNRPAGFVCANFLGTHPPGSASPSGARPPASETPVTSPPRELKPPLGLPTRRHACRQAVRTADPALASQLSRAYPECWHALTTTQTLVGGCATGLRLRPLLPKSTELGNPWRVKC